MKYLITTLFAGIMLFTDLEPQPKTYTLTITVNRVKDSSGSLAVAVYNDADEFPGGEPFKGDEKSLSSGGSIEIVIEDIPEGDYAFAAMHDANDNGDIDMNDQGMPTEGFGFSNDAMGDMGPPDFDQAAISIDGDTEIEINLIYLLGYLEKSK